jgi:PGF-CTERM protein
MTPEDTTDDDDDSGSSSGSIPGFGVGIALVAVLGAALLALRE